MLKFPGSALLEYVYNYKCNTNFYSVTLNTDTKTEDSQQTLNSAFWNVNVSHAAGGGRKEERREETYEDK